MSSCVFVTSIERRDQAVGEGEVGGLKLSVRALKVNRQASLIPIHQEPALRGKSRHEEEWKRPRGQVPIRERQDGDRELYSGTDATTTGKESRTASIHRP